MTTRSADRDLALEVARARTEAALFGLSSGTVGRDGADVPVCIGRFSLARRIGTGAMGVVYAGHDEILGRRVAIKLISPHRSGSRGAAERMLREAQALAKLSHPNVVPVFEAGVHGGVIFLVMEYVEGTTLRQYASETKPGWRALVSAYVQAGRGLCAAHDAGLVHRDFKPDNAMLGADNRVRVLDFGLVADRLSVESTAEDTLEEVDGLARLTRTGAVLGTPAYMAPEQYLGRTIDARADQFAFCVALHEAVYGVRPHGGDTLSELSIAVVDGRIEVPARRKPRWLYRVLRRGLATEPEDRYPDMYALLRALESGIASRRRTRIAIGSLALAMASLVGARAVSEPAPEPFAGAPTAGEVPRVERLAPVRQITRLTDDVQVLGVALSPSGASLAYSATRANESWVAIVPTRGGSGVATPRGQAMTGALAFGSEDEVLSVRYDPRGRIDVVATAAKDGTQRPVRAVPGAGDSMREGMGALALDGRSVALVDQAENRIVIVDADGRRTAVATTDELVVHMTWSPDLQRLAWIERDMQGKRPSRLLIAATDGSGQRELLADPALFGQPCAAATFAGNDHLVYALYESDTGLDISTLWERALDDDRLDFAGERRLVQDATPGMVASLTASADGRHLAFVRFDRSENIHVAAIEPTGALGEPRPVTFDTTNERLAGWTPDARGVVFLSRREGEPAFYARALDSDTPTRLFTPRSRDAFALGRDHERFLFADPLADGAADARVVSIAADGAMETLGTLSGPRRGLQNACAGGRCTHVSAEGNETVVRELSWSDRAPRELARFRSTATQTRHWFPSPDGARGVLLAWDHGFDLVSLTDGSAQRINLAEGADVKPTLQFAAWTPDATAFFLSGMYIDGNTYAIARVELDGSYTVVHTEANRWIHRPYVAPDGRHLAFGTWDFSGDVWMIER